MRKWLLVLALVAMSQNAAAEAFPIFGPGASSCRSVMEESRQMGNSPGTLDAVFQSWILGYLSGLNRPRLVVPDVDSSAIALWVHSYCEENPGDSLFLAVDLLYEQLKQRQRQ